MASIMATAVAIRFGIGTAPGVPSLLPGERITDEVVSYLRELTSEGARLHGASDPSFRTVRVLIE